MQIKTLLVEAMQELWNFDWNELGDLETIGTWPAAIKSLLALALFSLLLGSGYWLHIRNLQAALAAAGAEEISLQSQLTAKAPQAANLETYRQQLADAEGVFAALLSQLPVESEVPGLVDDITLQGQSNGLSFSNIELLPEMPREVYMEQPITISVNGAYHDLGAFVSGVSSLPRLVTLHDFHIGLGDSRDELAMQVAARTYRYSADEELLALQAYIRSLADSPPDAPELESHAAFSYGAALLRDPFAMPLDGDAISVQPGKSGAYPDPNRPKEPLEEHSLGSLKLAGAIADGSRIWSLVLDEASQVHAVRVGDYLGRNHGRIRAVSESRIDLVEMIVSGAGDWMERPQSLVLSE